jgi:hypothetical protein
MGLSESLSRVRGEKEQALKKLCEHPSIKPVVEALAEISADATFVEVEYLEERLPSMARGTIIWALRQIADLKWGRFITGRRGHETRLESSLPIRRIYDAVFGQQGLPTQVKLLGHTFHLRLTLDVRFDLPEDLTSAEAARLAAFIQSLPF